MRQKESDLHIKHCCLLQLKMDYWVVGLDYPWSLVFNPPRYLKSFTVTINIRRHPLGTLLKAIWEPSLSTCAIVKVLNIRHLRFAD